MTWIDPIQLSDDSDIEGHPNVDKKSLIRLVYFPQTLHQKSIIQYRWKQRDIHEKREARKRKIQEVKAGIACNDILRPRLQKISTDLSSSLTPLPDLSNLVERLQTNPSPEAPPTNAPGQPTYDAMILNLLLQVSEEAKKAANGKGDEVIGENVQSGIKTHLEKLDEHTRSLKEELATEEAEQKKHITSEDIHDGFDSKVCSSGPNQEITIVYQTSIVRSTQTRTTTHQECKTWCSQIKI